jgi:sugar transferase (PEP-CTERM/EpsH1 system associated)
LVHSEHGWNVDDLDGAKARPALLRRLHAVFVDHFVVVSRHLGEYLTRRAGVAPARIEQIYNGVDVDRFIPRQGPRAAAAPDGFWGERSFVIGTVGRLQPVKDQATLLDAAAQFIQGHPSLADSLRIVIVGGGPHEVQLRQRAAALGLKGRTWFTGPVTDVPALLSSFDVFVLPSLMEGVSNTLLEAMACGLPVVVTAVGGNTELVRDGKNALLFAPRDVERLAEHLARLAADRESAATMGRHSRALAVADFSLETMVRRYGDVYRRMSARSGRSGGAVDPDGATRRV